VRVRGQHARREDSIWRELHCAPVFGLRVVLALGLPLLVHLAGRGRVRIAGAGEAKALAAAAGGLHGVVQVLHVDGVAAVRRACAPLDLRVRPKRTSAKRERRERERGAERFVSSCAVGEPMRQQAACVARLGAALTLRLSSTNESSRRCLNFAATSGCSGVSSAVTCSRPYVVSPVSGGEAG
jgi:hypothetical protein